MRTNAVRRWAYWSASSSDIGFFLFIYPTLLFPFIAGLLPSCKSKARFEILLERWGKPRPAGVGLDRVSLYQISHQQSLVA